MGREFSSDSYFLESIKSYRFLVEQYPYNRISRGAMFTVGEVYRQDLEDPDEARKAFEDFIARYPQSEKATEAKDILKQLDRPAAEGAGAHSASPVPAARPPVEEVMDQGPSGQRQVTAVRRWVGPNYLRIVIEVNGEVKFESVRLSNPDRIVVNLQTARLSPDLRGKIFPVEDGFLRQVRVAQFSPDVARVVLDVEKIEAYSIFSLPNPFRLVIDVQGTAPTQIARTANPASPANAEERKPDKVRSPATSNPAPTERVEAAAKAPAPPPTQAKTETEPSTPQGYEEESPSVSPAPESKHSKKSKEETTTTTADGYPRHPTRCPHRVRLAHLDARARPENRPNRH